MGRKKSLFDYNNQSVNPNTGLTEQNSLFKQTLGQGLQGTSPTIKKSKGVYNPLTPNDFNPNEKRFEHITNPHPNDDSWEQRSALSQPTSEVIKRGLNVFKANFAAGLEMSASASLDLSSTINILQGKEKEFDSNVFGIGNQDVLTWLEDIQKENPIYEIEPGKFRPGQLSWWANQASSAGLGLGMVGETALETLAVSAATEGLGLIPELMNDIKKIPQLMKFAKTIRTLEQAKEFSDKAKTLKRTATTYAILNRVKESKMEAEQVFKESYAELLSTKNADGTQKYSEQEARDYAAKGATRTFQWNMPLMALDILTYRTMVFNPVSGKGVGALEKGIEGLTSKFGTSKLGKAAAWTLPKVFGMASEGAEEGLQYIGSEEGEHYARVLGGIDDGSTFGQRLGKDVKSDEFWNNVAGGVIGSPIIGGIMNMVNKAGAIIGGRQQKRLNNLHSDFVSNVGKMDSAISSVISEYENTGRTEEASVLRRQFGSNKALSALHLDALRDTDSGFETLTQFYQDTIEQISQGKLDNLQDLGFGNMSVEQADKVKAEFENYIEDANKMKDIYNKVSNQYNKNLVPEIAQQTFNLDRLISERQNVENTLMTDKSNLFQYNELTTQGKTIFDAINNQLVINSEVERLRLKKSKANTQEEKENIQGLIDNLRTKSKEYQTTINEINADESYNESLKSEDESIINSSMVNKEYIDKMSNKVQLDSTIRLQRAKLNKWNDPKYQEDKLRGSISTTRNVDSLERTQEYLENKGQLTPEIAEAIQEKKEEIASQELSKEVVNPFGNMMAITDEDVAIQAQEDTVRKPKAQNLSSAIESATSPIKTNGEDFFVEDASLFEPDEIKSDLSQESKDALRNFTLDYYSSLAEDLSKNPNFEDFIRDYVKTQGKEIADKQFNGLVKGWELAELTPANYKQVYNQIFRNRTEIGKSLNDTISSMLSEGEAKQETNKTLDEVTKKESKPVGFDSNNQPIYKHTSFTTHETHPKFAFSSRLSEAVLTDSAEENTYFVSYEYTSDELNEGQYVKSLKLLDPDKYIEGTKLVIRKPSNFNDILIPVYNSDGTKAKAMPFGQYVLENNLTPDMQEYQDKVPMLIIDNEGDAVAFVHDTNWYHPIRFNEDKVGQLEEARENTKRIRQEVLTGGEASIVITSKRNTTFEGLVIDKSKPMITINEANPQSVLGIADSLGQLKISNKESFEDDNNILINSSSFEPGRVYDIRRFGRNSNGQKTWIALPVTHGAINKETQDTIVEVIGVYLNQFNTSISQVQKASNDKIRQDVLSIVGLDIYNTKDFEAFIKQFIPTLRGVANSADEVAQLANTKLKIGQTYMFIDYQGGNIMFGIVGQKMSPKHTALSVGPNIFKNGVTEQKLSFVDGTFKLLKEKIVPGFKHDTSRAALGSNKPVINIVNGGIKIVGKDYKSYMKDNLKTNVKSYNIGTEENPNYVTNIQPIITYESTNELNKFTPKEVQKENLQIATESENVIDVTVSTATQEDVNDLVSKAESLTKWLGDDIMFEPIELTDVQVQEITSAIERVAGLTPSQQYHLVDFMFNQISMNVDFDNKEAVSLDSIRNNIKQEFDKTIVPIRNEYIQNKSALEGIYNSDKEKFSNLPATMNRLQAAINKVDNIISSFDEFEKLALAKVNKYTGIGTTTMEVNSEDTNEQDQDFSTDALQEDGKNNSSYRLKRFFAGIRDYGKDGQPKTSFLNLPVYIGFDVVYNTVSALLAEVPSDINIMMEKLESSKDAHKWLPELMGKLNNSSEQIKNEFVSTMSKHSLSMEFVMYGYDRETGNYSLKVYNTNANSIVDHIQKEWFNNFKVSPLVVSSEGVYEINIKRAEYLLDKFNAWNEKDYEQVENRGSLNLYKENLRDVKPGQSSLIKVSEPKLLNELQTKLNKTDKVVFTLDKKEYQFTKGTNGTYRISMYKPKDISVPELKEWLSEFGINVSDDTLKEVLTKGMYNTSKQGNDKMVKFHEMFHVSDNTVGLFGKLAYQLKSYIAKGTVNIEEDGDNPLKDSLIKSLANVEAKYNTHVISNSFRDNGRPIYVFTAPKYITDRFKDLKYDDNLRNQLSTLSFSKHSLWLNLLNNDAFRDRFNLSHMGLTSFKELGKQVYKENGINNLADADHELVKLGLFMYMNQGTFEMEGNLTQGIEMRMARVLSPTMSNKTTMTIIKTAVLNLKNKDLQDGNGFSSEVLEVLYSQIVKPELERIINFHNIVKNTNVKSYDKGAGMFFFVPQLNDLEVSKGVSLISYIKNNPDINMLTWVEDSLKNDIFKTISNVVSSLVDEKLSVWQENGYLKLDENKDIVEVKFFDNKYLNNDSKFRGSLNEKVRMTAMDFEINQLIANANSFMTIAGDPAQFYKEVERNTPNNNVQKVIDTFDNIGKRLANQIAPGIKIADSENNKYIQLFIKDRVSESENIDYLVRLYGEEGAKEYKNIEAADAQEYTTWKEHLYILEKLGRTPDIALDVTPQDMREAREIFSNETTLNKLTDVQKKIVNKVMQPIKPVYTGQHYDSKHDVMRVVYIKSSSFPLIPQLTKGGELDGLRTHMERLESHKGMTVRASYQTANKVGAVNNAIDLWNKDGRANDLITSDLEPSEELNTSSLILDRKNFRIQQDVPFKSAKRLEDTISIVTQATKTLFGNGILKLGKIFDYNGDTKTGKELHEIYNQLFNDLISEKRDNLYQQLGIDPITQQPFDIEKSMSKLQDVLIDEAVNRGYPKQDIDSLKLSYKKDSTGKVVDIQFTLPLWASANSNRFESLLNAIVTNRLLKIKFPGNSYVVGSEEGFKFKENLEGVNENKVVFTSKWTGNLKATYTEDGKLMKGQILVPSKFRNKDGVMIDLTSSKYSQRDENGILRLKQDMIQEELMSLSSFRIPVSGHVSMAELEIVGFLPYEVGDLMIVPKNLTKQKGLDFDIDKENTYQLWHQMDDEGKISLYSGEDNEKKITNEIIKIHKSILSNPSDEVQKKINKVLSIEYAKQQAQFIDEIINQDNTIFSPISSEYQKKKMILASSAQIGTGAYSLDVVGHSLFEQSALTKEPLRLTEIVMDEEGKSKKIFKSFVFGKYKSDGILGLEKTLDGSRDIAEVLGERQNFAVDGETAKVMDKVNLNNLTLDVDKVFCLLGFDKGEDGNSISFLFMSQPIIRDYVKKMSNANANIAEFTPDKEQKIVDQLLIKYGSELDIVNDEYWKLANDMMANKNLVSSLDPNSNPNNFLQGAVLRRFLEMKKYGEAIRKIQTTINTDSEGLGKSTFDVIEKIDSLNKLSSNTLVSNTQSLIGEFVPMSELNPSQIEDRISKGYYELGSYLVKPDTVVGTFNILAVNSAYNLWNKYFPYNSRTVNATFDELLEVMGKEGAEESKRIELKQEIFREMRKYLYSNMKLGLNTNNPQEERARLFMDTANNTSLANYIRELRLIKDNPVIEEFIKGNKLINRFELDVNTNGLPSIIKFNNAASENFDEEYMYNSFIELIESNRPLPDISGRPYNTRLLAQDLIMYAYLEGGIQQAIQFVKYVPISYLNAVGFSTIMSQLDFNRHNVFHLVPKTDTTKHLVSRFTTQYAQHNPQRMPKLSEDDVKNKIVNPNTGYDSTKLESLESFELKEKNNPKTFVSIYNPKINKGKKKFQLYWFNGVKYVKIPTLGVFGMSEYDLKSDNYQSLVNGKVKNKPEPQESSKTPSEVKTDNFGLNSGNLSSVLSEIVNSNIPYLSDLVKQTLPYINASTKIVVASVQGRGQYNHKENTIYISQDWIMNGSKEDLARTITKEFIHSITVGELKKYYNTNGTLVDNAPAYILKLQRLFSQTEKHLGGKLTELRSKVKGTPLTAEEKRVTYGGYDIYEFVEMIMTQPEFQQEMDKVKLPDGKSLLDKFKEVIKSLLESIGVNFDENSVTSQSISSIFELLEGERKTTSNPFGHMVQISEEDFNMVTKKEDNIETSGETDFMEANELIDSLLNSGEIVKINC